MFTEHVTPRIYCGGILSCEVPGVIELTFKKRGYNANSELWVASHGYHQRIMVGQSSVSSANYGWADTGIISELWLANSYLRINMCWRWYTMIYLSYSTHNSCSLWVFTQVTMETGIIIHALGTISLYKTIILIIVLRVENHG